MSDLRLIGYRYSVYTRAARMGLCMAGRDYDYQEVDPFDPSGPVNTGHPMGRVPVLNVGQDKLYETAAILAWCDTTRGWHASPMTQARATQVCGIVDAYGYWPLVRQVYSHGWFRPAMGAPSDKDQVAAGLEASGPVLDMLDTIAQEGTVLTGTELTRADCHLAPMVDAFQRVDEGADLLAQRPALAAWFKAISRAPAFTKTAANTFPEAS